MALDPQLQNKVKNAADKQLRQSARPTTGRAIFADLHQLIAGPVPSEVLAQATDYAAAVTAEGNLVRNKTPVILDGNAWPANAGIEAELKKGERGVTIINNLDSLTSAELTKFRPILADLMSTGHGVFVIAGTPQAIARLVQGHPVLEKKLNVPFDLTPPSSQPAGQPAPPSPPQPDAAPQASAPGNRQKDIIAQWRETRDCDICTTTNDVAAPMTAVFRKKIAPVT